MLVRAHKVTKEVVDERGLPWEGAPAIDLNLDVVSELTH